MKAVEFSNKLKEAGYMLAGFGDSEPTIVVRQGRTGPDIPLKTIKVKRGYIILEF